jgi:hypothetical protein
MFGSLTMFTLAIDNVVEVPVKFTLKAGKVNKPFSATLTARRLSKEESESQSADLSIKDFLLDNITDWSGQRLVLDANGEPAAFSRDALDAFLSVGGVLGICWNAYLRECAGKEKN